MAIFHIRLITLLVNIVWISCLLDLIFSAEMHEYCSSETFEARCSDGQVILMRSAAYGRMEPNRCISAQYNMALGCKKDVMQNLDGECSGKQSCQLLIATLEAITEPCDRDFKSYLKASYDCVNVVSAYGDRCRGEEIIQLPGTHGFLTVPTGQKTSHSCVYDIHATPGEQIALNAMVFRPLMLLGLTVNHQRGNTGTLTGKKSRRCPVTVEVLTDTSTSFDLCSVVDRNHPVYISAAHRLRMRVEVARISHDPFSGTPRFMLGYKAIGCPDIEATGNLWVSRTDDSVLVRCNETNETWFLTCQDNAWVGEIGNCSSDRHGSFQKIHSNSSSFHKGWIVFAIIIGVILGLLVGTGLLTTVLVWRKRHQTRQRSSAGSRPGDGSLHHQQMQSGLHGHQHNLQLHDSVDLHGYPALLRQEKSLAGNISEYTHVWEVQAPSVVGEPGGNGCPHLHTFKRVPTCDLHSREGCSCVGAGGAGIYGTKESIYDSRRVVPVPINQPSINPSTGQKDDPLIGSAPKSAPLYFDMDLTASIPQQARGNTTPIRTLQLTNS